MDKRRRERQGPLFSKWRTTSFDFECLSVVFPTIFSEGKRKRMGRSRGGRGRSWWRTSARTTLGDQIPRFFHTVSHKNHIYRAPYLRPTFVCNVEERQRERETASPFNLGTGSRYAGQNNCLATWNLLQWMERERGFQPVGFSTYFFFLQILESYTSSIPCNKFLHLSPLFIHQFKTIILRERNRVRKKGRRDKEVSIATDSQEQ